MEFKKYKDLATSISLLLVLMFIVAIGATLSAFGVAPKKVELKKISVSSAVGISVTDKKGKSLSSLDIKSSDMGMRPATGDEDIETEIPNTINDSVGTEGSYACFFVTTNKPFKIVLSGASLSAGAEDNLDNLKIAIMDKKCKAINGADLYAVLGEFEPAEKKEMIVVVWLDEGATKSIASADVEISLSFEYL